MFCKLIGNMNEAEKYELKKRVIMILYIARGGVNSVNRKKMLELFFFDGNRLTVYFALISSLCG